MAQKLWPHLKDKDVLGDCGLDEPPGAAPPTRPWKASVPALVAAGQAGLPATQEAVFGALLLAAGGSLDWR